MGAYDLDDGIYFVSDESDKKDLEWYHTEIYEAVKDHTSKGAEDNDPCVTVLYADGHHVDLPCYFMVTGESPQLSHRKTPWIESDPKGLRKWFNDECANKVNLKRIVRYLKAWCDNIKDETDKKCQLVVSLQCLLQNISQNQLIIIGKMFKCEMSLSKCMTH